jgi:hypothetical protein
VTAGKTLHVIPRRFQWRVLSEGGPASPFFPSKPHAIAHAEDLARRSEPHAMVVIHRRDGSVEDLPPVLPTPIALPLR